MKHFWTIIALVLLAHVALAQNLSGLLQNAENQKGICGVEVILDPLGRSTQTDNSGRFSFENVPDGQYVVVFRGDMLPEILRQQVEMRGSDQELTVQAKDVSYQMGPVSITDEQEKVQHLRSVEGMAIYAGKKTELINIDQLNANIATNNARQVFNRVPGLNIWENDGGGLQLGIGGRGLNPNRSSNFNTRQNGYDMAADALGYPESYYTPPVEALQRIEVVRGAASLQYGTQFGGMVNFKFKEGPADKKFSLTTRQTLGSYGYFSSFNSIGGTVGKLNYRAFYQGKRGNGWRENAGFQQHTAFGDLHYQVSKSFRLELEYTFMHYLAQQPGGLTDALFDRDPRQSIRDRNWFQVNWNLACLVAEWEISPKTKLNMRNFGLHARRDALGYLGAINRTDPGKERDLITGAFQNIGNETRILHKWDFKSRPAAFLAGLRYYQGFTTNQQGLASAGSGPDFYLLNPEAPEHSSYTFPSRNLALFAEQYLPISTRFSITPGIRYEFIQTASEGSYTIRTTDFSGNVLATRTFEDDRQKARSILLAGLGTAYKVNSELESYFNFSTNYRAITFNDMRVVNPNFEIDPNLKDERGFNADLGLRGKLSKWLWVDASLFCLYYKDRIGQVLMTDTATFRYYRFRTNVSDAYSAGLEAFAEADLLQMLGSKSEKHRLNLFGNFAWIEAQYISSQSSAFEGKRVELVPRFNSKWGINYHFGHFKAGIQWSQTSGQYSDATNAEVSPNALEGWIPAYNVLDLTASYSWKKLSLECSANNLLNRMYFTRRAAGYPGPGIIPAEGRSLFVTLGLNL